MSHFSGSFRQSFTRMSPPAKILLVVVSIIVFLFISSVAALLVAMPVFHLSMGDIYQISRYPDAGNIGVVKFFQIIESFFLFLLPALMAAWLFSERSMTYLKADRKPSAISVLLVMCSLVAAIPMMNSLAQFNSAMELPGWMHSVETRIKNWEENAGRVTELFLAGENTRDLALNMLMIGILPALGEEFLFRGVLQRLFAEWTKNIHLGVWISAFLFSFIHLQFYGFLPRLLLGLYFGYLLVWSGSIWVPVAGHFMNNGFAVIYYHFSGLPMGDTYMDKMGTETQSHFWLYLSVFFTLVLVALIFIQERTRHHLSASSSGRVIGE